MKAAVPKAGFIFRGTVERVGDSTVPHIKADKNTAVVRVDEVIAAPAVIAHTGGRQLTVITDPGVGALKPGERCIFHARSAAFGEDLAVRVSRVEPTTGAAVGISAARAVAAPLPTQAATQDPVQAHRDLTLKRHLDEANLVVTGTVTEVRLSPETQAIAAAVPRSASPGNEPQIRTAPKLTAGKVTPAPSRISEHDPIWQEAVVSVDTVEKGKLGKKEITIRFPASNDVRWRTHPKFKPGQHGVFLLQGATGLATARVASHSTTLSSGDQPMEVTTEPQPMSTIERVRQLLSAPQTPAPSRVLRRHRTGTTSRRRRRR
jgi:hypothetical protein